MKILSHSDFQNFCVQSGIEFPNSKSVKKIGKYLSFKIGPKRTVVIHIVESDSGEYLTRLFQAVLSVETTWILSSRVRYRGDVNFGDLKLNQEVITVTNSDKNIFSKFLFEYLHKLRSVSDDLFIVGHSGNVIIKYDHHIFSDGLDIYMNDIKKTSKLLKSLNELGAELNLYYCEG